MTQRRKPTIEAVASRLAQEAHYDWSKIDNYGKPGSFLMCAGSDETARDAFMRFARAALRDGEEPKR